MSTKYVESEARYRVGLVTRRVTSVQTLFPVKLWRDRHWRLWQHSVIEHYYYTRVYLLVADVYESGSRACRFCYFRPV